MPATFADGDLPARSYEELRTAALSGRLRFAQGGSAFLTRGMFGWMQLASDIPHPQLGAISVVPQAPTEALRIPGDVAHQLVQTLATMLFDRRIGEVTYGS